MHLFKETYTIIPHLIVSVIIAINRGTPNLLATIENMGLAIPINGSPKGHLPPRSLQISGLGLTLKDPSNVGYLSVFKLCRYVLEHQTKKNGTLTVDALDI